MAKSIFKKPLNHHGAGAIDHDFVAKTTLKLFGIHAPEIDENQLYFTESSVTADFMVDALEDFWRSLENRVDLQSIVINADYGPENSSRPTQFIKRIDVFDESNSIDISLLQSNAPIWLKLYIGGI